MWSSRGSHPNTALRITVALVAVLIIATAITIAKRKPIAVADTASGGDESEGDSGQPAVTSGKPATSDGGSPEQSGSSEHRARV
jgi:hypothetical protein